MAKEFKIVISPDGKVMTSVYNDFLDVSQIGTPKINRATEVRYNNERGHWEVIALRPLFDAEMILANHFKNRADALDWEIAFLNINMEKIIEHRSSHNQGTKTQS